MEKDFLIINSKDNVGINLNPSLSIKVGHKIALKDIKKGEYIFKYGEIIGVATSDIKKGQWVHVHNLKSHLDESFSYFYKPNINKINFANKTFYGYKRENGDVGIRNDIYIIPTVGCVNSVAQTIADKANLLPKGNIDSIFALTHQFGCSQLGNDQENIKKVLAHIALNPNASFVLFIGLGCENNTLNGIKEFLKPYHRTHIAYFNSQEVSDEIEYGFNIVKDFISKASKFNRELVSYDKLVIGLKCGGSDAFSGISANPLVGQISDKIISYGGTSILSEVPEMFGAEQTLMNKCLNIDVFEKYKKLIVDFKKYYLDLGFPIYENPSPGNKEGGISTLEEKSLGCITKGGSSPINDVIYYGDLVKKKGLNILDGPGNDLIASTALGVSGAQLILFTTGRGTPFSTFVPTLKISTNKIIANYKNNWIDFDASNFDVNALEKLIDDTINGKYKTKQENHHEIAFFKKGVTL